jgi:hypothetical protein
MKNLNEKERALIFWCAMTIVLCGSIVLLAIIVTSK